MEVLASVSDMSTADDDDNITKFLRVDFLLDVFIKIFDLLRILTRHTPSAKTTNMLEGSFLVLNGGHISFCIH